MKRDWDLIRKLLTAIEEEEDFLADSPTQPKWLEQTEEAYITELKAFRTAEGRLFGHLELLLDNGYSEGFEVIRMGDGGFAFSLSAPRLTMAGHDLLDTMRSSKVWEWIKSTANTKGVELSFDAVKALGALALKNVLG
ncbi:Hypothetical protein SAMN05518669_12757 [Variovorax sp. YR634]|uniref:DUF2513 domain-containing protein n=1 Tax=Variovorax sp. YR634 TaxID=1884385 RepID=UPI000897B72F|nr:DUF2513 domain-containing protein [Variovorax sp. YR634]SDZ30821.1 Hypothetical protein SAMN05518669_12757 [Variovorax sp. YR634]